MTHYVFGQPKRLHYQTTIQAIVLNHVPASMRGLYNLGLNPNVFIIQTVFERFDLWHNPVLMGIWLTNKHMCKLMAEKLERVTIRMRILWPLATVYEQVLRYRRWGYCDYEHKEFAHWYLI